MSGFEEVTMNQPRSARAIRVRRIAVPPLAWVVPFAMLMLLLGCSDSTSSSSQIVTQTSFEQGLGEWSAHAADVTVGGQEIDWSIDVSTDRASAGSSSVRFTAENLSDAAKLWIQRPLDLEPNTTYRITIAFDFATADVGVVNLWRILAGALPSDPDDTQDLQPAFQGETGKPDNAAGYTWLDKSYQQTITTDSVGTVIIVVGVWGTYEVTRTYYVDQVRITAERVN